MELKINSKLVAEIIDTPEMQLTIRHAEEELLFDYMEEIQTFEIDGQTFRGILTGFESDAVGAGERISTITVRQVE